jgi:hypothetical protein
MLTYYEVIGVSVDATFDEIRQAYHRKAQLLHPDRHIGAAPGILHESEDSMALLNKAWEILSNPERRQAYDQALNIPSATQPTFRLPQADECMFCGSVPATTASLGQETGKLLWRTRRRLDGPFCRDCGIGMFNFMTNRTLITGWWGILSALTNVATIIGNFSAWRRYRALPMAQRQPNVRGAMDGPIPWGKPLWQRLGPWFAAAVLGLAGIVIASSQSPSLDTPSPTDGPKAFVNRCVQDGTEPSSFSWVDCTTAHDGKVVNYAFSQDGCPSDTEQYIRISEMTSVLCVDTDQ